MVNSTSQNVAELESMINSTLPKEFKKWLIKGNFAVPEKNFYWVIKDDWGSGIDCFYDFNLADTEKHNLKDMVHARSNFKIPLDLIAIGDDGIAGTFICLGISGNRYGKIFFVDTNQTPNGQYTDSKYVYLIGKNFDSWVSSLVDDPDE